MTTLHPSQDARAMLLYDASKKSTGVAYLLWFLFGAVGGHRFYLGRTGSAIAMLLIFLASWPLLLVGIGVFGFGVVGMWALVDAFLIPGMLRMHNAALIATLT